MIKGYLMAQKSSSEKIGLVTATIICMNAMIGAGIFSTPAKLATSVGPAGILSYAFVIIAVLFIALSIARVAELYPQEGSFYTYAKQWGGHTMGILSAGSYVVGVVIALGLLTQMAADRLHILLPQLSLTIIGFLLITAIVSLTMSGVRFVQSGQLFLICCTLFSLVATIVLCLSHASLKNLVPFAPHGWHAVISATKAAIFAFFGFESAASLFNIVKDPGRTVPRALTLSIVLVGALYMAFIGSIILAIPAGYFTSARMPLEQTIINAFPKYAWVGYIIGLSIITALLGVLQSMTYSVSMLAFSFFKLLHTDYAKKITQSPYGFNALIIIVGLCTFFNFMVFKNIDLFYSLTAIGVVFAFITSILTLVLKKQDKTLAQKILTSLALIAAAIIFLIALKDLIQAIIK